MGNIDRRRFLQGAAALSGGAVVAGPLQTILASAAGATPPDRFGVLGPVPDLRDGAVRLHLPPGFRYRSFHDTEVPVTLHDGTALPGRHDGMAAFDAAGGNVWLVRNHEVNGPVPAFGPGAPYDPATGGGTTTMLVSPDGEVLDSFTSCNGTQMNCSGGPMPWGSWLTCEETVNGPDVGADFTGALNVTLTKPHGYVFEVPAGGRSDRRPITAAGRFAHEAAAYSHHDRAVYLTEDNFGFPSHLYRYVPRRDPMQLGHLDDEGRLQVLVVDGRPNLHLEGTQVNGASYPVRWADIEEPDVLFPYTQGQPAPTTNNEAINWVGDQARVLGAAHFSRLEGATAAAGAIHFTSTQGGGPPETGPDTTTGYGNGSGQLWAYDVRRRRLTCRFQSPGPDVLDFPDNLAARNDRGTIVMCEDNVADNYVRGLSRHGRLFDIALNRVVSSTGANRFNDEFAGATFGAGGETLFVNIQASRGMTFAVWGPWGRLGV
jgi:secreted PhoX family phosphatase